MSSSSRLLARSLRISAFIFASLVVLAAAGYVLSNRLPSWWVDPALLAADPASELRGGELEQQLAASVSKVRPQGASWAMRIRQTDVNAWIAARLPQWKEHDPSLVWPVEGAATQVRFEEGCAIVALAMEGRVWSATCAIEVVPGAIAIVPSAGAIGTLPVPGGAALAMRWLEGAGAKTLRLPRIFALGDGRHIEVLHIDVHPGTIEIECITR